jgi:hypothetical protein
MLVEDLLLEVELDGLSNSLIGADNTRNIDKNQSRCTTAAVSTILFIAVIPSTLLQDPHVGIS